jgi:hypothetical protein
MFDQVNLTKEMVKELQKLQLLFEMAPQVNYQIWNSDIVKSTINDTQNLQLIFEIPRKQY